ncbi:choice-of-anchor Q domain-containing protein [Spirosoma pulveris]
MRTTFTDLLFVLSTRSLLGSLLWIISSLGLQAQTVYVTPAGAGQQSGADWANALPGSQLQPTLKDAQEGSVFRLAAGLYKPSATGDRMVSFIIPSGVQVVGGYTGSQADPNQRMAFTDPEQPSSTTLSGDIDNDNRLDEENTNNVVRFSAANEQTLLDGVVVTGGNATTTTPDLRYASNTGGGGVFLDAGMGSNSPLIRNCLFTHNTTIGLGGAVYNDAWFGLIQPKFIHCDFVDNSAAAGGAFGIYVYRGRSSMQFTNCRFIRNSAGTGGVNYNYVYGELGSPGISNPKFFNCEFTNNRASGSGGVMYNYVAGGSGTTAAPGFLNCTLSGNQAQSGGAFYNVATPYYVHYTHLSSGPAMTNCILWNNGGSNAIINEHFTQRGDVTSTGEGVAEAYNSVLEAGTTLSYGSENQIVTTSPFLNEQTIQLRSCSPAINLGKHTSYLTGPEMTTDLAGNPRVYPEGGRVDIGAYEYQQESPAWLMITQQPASQNTVIGGSPLQVPVGLSSPATTYSWYRNGSIVSGQQSATLTLASVQPDQAGDYSLVALGTCNSVTSTASTVVVVPPVSLVVSEISASTTTLCAGTTTTLTAQVTGGTAPYTYAWSATGGATLRNALVNTIELLGNTAQPLLVRVLITDAASMTTSATLSLVVKALHPAAFSGLPTSLCQGTGSISLTAETPGGIFTGPGMTANLLLTQGLTPEQSYTITYSVSSQGCTSSSSQAFRLVTTPAAPRLLTQSGQLYPGNQSFVDVAQFSGVVNLVSTGCSGGTVKWQGPNNQSGTGNVALATATVGTFIYSARCQQGACVSEPAQATVVVKSAPLQFVPPVFDCASGKLTLRTIGGNGQAIEYQISGVTQGWSTQNPVVLSAKQTTKPLKLNARQRATTNQGFDNADLTYSVPACAGSRLGVEEARPELTVRVLGNPANAGLIKLTIAGAEGYPVKLQLTDLTGRLLIEQQIDRAGALEECQLPSDKVGSGLFLVHVLTPIDSQTIKVINNPN